MTALDHAIFLRCVHLALRHPELTHLMGFLNNCVLLKGDLFMAVCVWLWFARSADRDRRRQVIISTLAAAFLAIIVGRALALLLPFRVRPMFDPSLGLHLPWAADSSELRNWSAFPSDHAVLFGAIATGLCFVSWPLGLAAQAYWLLMVGVPRIYLGMHNTSDVLAGGAVGVVLAWLVNWEPSRQRLSRAAFWWRQAHPASFYACTFLVAAEIGTMFSDVREILAFVARVAHLTGG